MGESCHLEPNPVALGAIVTIDPPPAGPPLIDGLSWLPTAGQAIILDNGPFDIPGCPPLQVIPPFDLTGELPPPQPDNGPEPFYTYNYLLPGLLVILSAVLAIIFKQFKKKATTGPVRLADDIRSRLLNFQITATGGRERRRQFIEFYALLRTVLAQNCRLAHNQPSCGELLDILDNQALRRLLREGEELAYSGQINELAVYENFISKTKQLLRCE